MKILICGDYCPQDRVVKIQNSKPNEIFEDVKGIISQYEHKLLNLECPLFSEITLNKISKAGPNLCADSATAAVIKNAGFDVVTLANNHILDYGQDGVMSTLKALDSVGIRYLGLKNESVGLSKSLYINEHGEKIGIVNICESEFNIAPRNNYSAIPIDVVDLFEDITNLKKDTNYIVVIIHGGHEHYQLPSPRMKKLYRFIIDIGANVVVNHHQHCYSGYELYNNGYIFYGLGNFCFDDKKKRNQKWNYGYMLGLSFTSDLIDFTLHPYIQCNEEPVIKRLNVEEEDFFKNEIEKLNCIIADDEKLNNEFNNFINRNRKRYISYFSPYLSRYTRYLCRKGFMPSCLNKNKANVLLDMIRCESHRDISEKILSTF